MADVHDSKTRSKNMRAIRNRGTAIEKKVADMLQKSGFVFREQAQDLSGKPDFVLDDYKAVIFVHGCFWHYHDCHLFQVPATRTDFWMNKIQSNVLHDQKIMQDLSSKGWRMLVVWECSLKGRLKLSAPELGLRLEEWICAASSHAEMDTKGIHQINV